jgi:serine/threonine-protein kinase
MEFEWEKAARGVDGRSYPWGDAFDPSRSCMKDSHRGEVHMQDVDSFPEDESVYGVRGTAGNTRDWCLDRFREDGPPLLHERLVMPSSEDLGDTGFKSTRGGSYGNSASRARSADRDWWFPERSYVGRGFRLAWGLADWTRSG